MLTKWLLTVIWSKFIRQLVLWRHLTLFSARWEGGFSVQRTLFPLWPYLVWIFVSVDIFDVFVSTSEVFVCVFWVSVCLSIRPTFLHDMNNMSSNRSLCALYHVRRFVVTCVMVVICSQYSFVLQNITYCIFITCRRCSHMRPILCFLQTIYLFDA